jgi:hypothetical protein
MRRVTRHRRRPELLARVREWRRPPTLEHRFTGEFRFASAFGDPIVWQMKDGEYVGLGDLGGSTDVIDVEAAEVHELSAGPEGEAA